MASIRISASAEKVFLEETLSGDGYMKKEIEELVVQEFPYRCPYCDQLVSYENIELRVGENEVECPSCKRKYIKVVFVDWEKKS